MKTMRKIACFLITAMMLTAVMSLGAHAELYKDYASAADGDLLYVADFRGESVFSPKPNNLAAEGLIYTPQEEGRELHVQGKQGFEKKCFLFGGDIKGLTADRTTKYTFVYDIKMNGESGKNNSVGVGGLGWDYLDTDTSIHFPGDTPFGRRFFCNYGNYNSVFPADKDEPNRSALSIRTQKCGDYTNGIEDAVSDLDGFITCRIDFDGPANVFRAYAITSKGWTLLEEQPMKEINSSAASAYTETQAVGFWIYTYYDIVDFTLRDVRWFKGVNLTEEQLSVVEPLPAAGEAEQAQPEAAAPAKAPTSARTADAAVIAVLAAVTSLGAAVVTKRRRG